MFWSFSLITSLQEGTLYPQSMAAQVSQQPYPGIVYNSVEMCVCVCVLSMKHQAPWPIAYASASHLAGRDAWKQVLATGHTVELADVDPNHVGKIV